MNPLVQPINRASVRVASMPTGGPTLVDMTHRGPWPLPEVRDTAVVDSGDHHHAGRRMRRNSVDAKVVCDQIHALECVMETVARDEQKTQQHDPEQKRAP